MARCTAHTTSGNPCRAWAIHGGMIGTIDRDFPHFDLGTLTPRQHEIIEMHYSCNLSFGAIAMFLGVSKGTVQSHHSRALDKLVDAMSYGQDLK